jgi:ABC-2 type transport system ATP-binding protein
VIEANGLCRRFGSFVAVDQVTLHVPDGTILALLGANGAGKTTTVRMLAGLLAPSAGTAVVAGFDVRRAPAAVRAHVGLVTDVPGLYEQMTPVSYLDFFGAIYGIPADRRRRRIDELLTFFELADHRKERMSGFSKGMKQKLALARALLHEPAALFLDEPTSGLDPLATRAVRDLIVNLKHASRSIILCTHDLDEAERLADQVAIMRRGQIAAYDSPAALRAHASPEATVRVEFAAPCPEARTALRAIPGVLGLDGAPEATERETESTRLVYRTSDPTTVNPLVVARLVALGAPIVTITSAMRSLEDVYADAMGTSLPASTQRIGSRGGEPEGGAGLHPYTREAAEGSPSGVATHHAPQARRDQDQRGAGAAARSASGNTPPSNGHGGYAGAPDPLVPPGMVAPAAPGRPESTADAPADRGGK